MAARGLAIGRIGRIGPIGLLCLLLLAPARAAESAAARFDQANRLYEQRQYAEAAAAYEALLATGRQSAALHFNLGNAHFKAGHLGRAIAAFRTAERLAPRDPDIRANLRFARQSVGGSASPSPALWQRALGWLRADEWALATAGVFWVWLALLTLRRLRRRPGRRGWLARVAGIGVLCTAAATAFDYFGIERARVAIVIRSEAVARYGPLEESQSHFTVRDGAELPVADTQGDWLQVIDPAGRPGWLRQETVIVQP